MGNVGEIRQEIAIVKATIGAAPYVDAAKAFNGLEIIDGDALHAKLSALVTNLKEYDTMPSLVAGTAAVALAELARTQEGNENMKPEVSKAFDHLDVMDEKAKSAQGRTEVMRGLAEKALELYEQFTTTMEEFEGSRAQGERDLKESAQGAQLAKQSIAAYEATL